MKNMPIKTDWKEQSDYARKKAVWEFCKMLEDQDLKEKCMERTPEACALAHSKLKEAGDYTNMPPAKDLKVFVFTAEELAADQDKMVVLILPRTGTVGDLAPFDSEKVWVATWNHWAPSAPIQ